VAIRARTFTYAVSLDREGTARSQRDCTPLTPAAGWTPEHLVLLGLVRCSLTSLRFHAKAGGIEVAARAEGSATVTRRESDGRYAFTEIGMSAELTLAPRPADVQKLLALAERDCFVGASLAVTPTYSWTVNGEEVR
jgi:organic hydroperoxide reductase OsmC/OhrA